MGKSRVGRQSPYHDDFNEPPRPNTSISGSSILKMIVVPSSTGTNWVGMANDDIPNALLALNVFAIPLFALPILNGEVFTLRDHFDYFLPLRDFTAQFNLPRSGCRQSCR